MLACANLEFRSGTLVFINSASTQSSSRNARVAFPGVSNGFTSGWRPMTSRHLAVESAELTSSNQEAAINSLE